jgi:hypothetical protein
MYKRLAIGRSTYALHVYRHDESETSPPSALAHKLTKDLRCFCRIRSLPRSPAGARRLLAAYL